MSEQMTVSPQPVGAFRQFILNFQCIGQRSLAIPVPGLDGFDSRLQPRQVLLADLHNSLRQSGFEQLLVQVAAQLLEPVIGVRQPR